METCREETRIKIVRSFQWSRSSNHKKKIKVCKEGYSILNYWLLTRLLKLLNTQYDYELLEMD